MYGLSVFLMAAGVAAAVIALIPYTPTKSLLTVTLLCLFGAVLALLAA